jgi:hypothetical protein
MRLAQSTESNEGEKVPVVVNRGDGEVTLTVTLDPPR